MSLTSPVKRGLPPRSSDSPSQLQPSIVSVVPSAFNSTINGAPSGGGGGAPSSTNSTSNNGTINTGGPANDHVPESMKKLRALKEKIQQEFQQEHKERVDHENREIIIPLSLAQDYCPTVKRSSKGIGKPQPAIAVDKFALIPKDKLANMKALDKYVQRDIERELEKKALENLTLKAQNQRLREIVTLRQESNTRKEQKLEFEVDKLKVLTDETCVDTTQYGEMMQRLRDMNSGIQEGAAKLRSTIDEQSEAERMALIRTYRVRMRDVKQQLHAQEATNLNGASAWITRYNILDADREAAEVGLKMLESRNKLLQADNSELKVMHKHQEQQRENLTTKIAVIKRENKRLNEHIAEVSKELGDVKSTASPAVRHTQSRDSSRGDGTSRRPWQMTTDRYQTNALTRLRKVLEDMRRSLSNVRSAHVELLQERTELEMFLRQCIEDVRRDMYRFTVVNNVSRNVNADVMEERMVLQDYGVKDRRRLIDILNSKLHVLTLMHSKMFPNKIYASDAELGEFFPPVPAESPKKGGAESNALVDVSKSVAVAAERDMDTLWVKWKQWTRSVTPEL